MSPPSHATRPIQYAYLQEQVALIETHFSKALFGSWIAALLMLTMFHPLGAQRVWAWWFCGYSLLVAGSYWLARWASAHYAHTPPARINLLMVSMGLIGASWGLTTTLLHFAGGDIPALSMASAVAAGVAGAALGFCGSCWRVYASHLVLTVALINVGYILHGGHWAGIFAVFSSVYMLVLLVFGRTVETSALRSIQLRFENAELLTNLRQQTHEANEARSQAEAHSQDKSRFLAAASHDLRQPIHALGLFLEALALTPLNGKQRAIFDNATQACDASRNMLGTLLDFSRLDAGVVNHAPHNFAVQTVLADLYQEYAPQAEEKGLVFRLHDTPWAAYSDPALVSLVVRNLIANAVRYTQQGGILVGCRKRGKQLVIEVWDTGIGIPANEHQRIFKEFLQLSNPERDRTKGLGLGLAIVQGLCRVMGSQIALCSAVGRGSVFRLTLPMADGVVVDSLRLDGESMPRVQGLRVLVVDDEAAVRESMQQLLTSWGCECTLAAGLHDALDFSPQQAPDVVVTDYRLHHGITGKDVIQALRQRWGSGLHCVIVTGDTAPDRLRDAHDTGAVLLHKPLTASQLMRALVPA